uniref:C6 domain-containing protein n=1 Tax=Caenorhabditis tropicalis TaxID=1561998 RepID=A0A1I7TLQ8_9PELO
MMIRVLLLLSMLWMLCIETQKSYKSTYSCASFCEPLKIATRSYISELKVSNTFFIQYSTDKDGCPTAKLRCYGRGLAFMSVFLSKDNSEVVLSLDDQFITTLEAEFACWPNGWAGEPIINNTVGCYVQEQLWYFEMMKTPSTTTAETTTVPTTTAETTTVPTTTAETTTVLTTTAETTTVPTTTAETTTVLTTTAETTTVPTTTAKTITVPVTTIPTTTGKTTSQRKTAGTTTAPATTDKTAAPRKTNNATTNLEPSAEKTASLNLLFSLNITIQLVSETKIVQKACDLN